MSLESFIDAYVEAALGSSTYPADDEGSPVDPDVTEDYRDTPMDDSYGPEDVADSTLATMRDECADFYRGNAGIWTEAGMSDEQAGHDFWLTRNGHGAGFWDRGLGEAGNELTKASKPYGSFDLYVGDDGKVYGS